MERRLQPPRRMANQLTDAVRARIRARERQRIAHDLHDGTGQLLARIARKLSEASRLASRFPAASRTSGV